MNSKPQLNPIIARNSNVRGADRVKPCPTHKSGLNGLGRGFTLKHKTRLSHSKKGVLIWVYAVAAVAIVLGFVLLKSTNVFGFNKAHSLTPPSSGYDEDKCPDMGVLIGGHVNVEDSAVFDLEPSIRDISVDEIRINNKKALNIGTEQFTYEVTATDEVTQEPLDDFKGSGELRSKDKSISKPYSLNFVIPDMNCDRRLDDFNVQIKATLKGDDIGERKEYEKLIRFRKGSVAK